MDSQSPAIIAMFQSPDNQFSTHRNFEQNFEQSTIFFDELLMENFQWLNLKLENLSWICKL